MPTDIYQGLQKTLQTLGDKWSCLILFAIYEGCNRYTDLDHRVEGICPRSLTQKIASLEEQGLIQKVSYQPNRYHYLLTEKGQSVIPVLQAMGKWGGEG